MKHLNLFSKMMLILLLFVLPLWAFSIYSIKACQSTLERTLVDSAATAISAYLDNLETEIQRLQDITYAYALDENLVKLSVIYDEMSAYDRVEATVNARKNLALLKEISPYAQNIYAYLPDMGRKLNALNCDYALTQAEADALIQQDNRLFTTSDGRMLVRSYYPVGMTLGQTPKLMLAVEISTKQIEQALSSMERSSGLTAMLYGEDFLLQGSQAALSDADAAYIETNIAGAPSGSNVNAVFHGRPSVFIWQDSPTLGAKLVVFVPKDTLLQTLNHTKLYLAVIILLMLAALLAIAYFTYRMVHVPMRRIMTALQEVEKSRRDVRLHFAPGDEFRYLATQFNRMMDNLDDLIQQVYEWKILTQQSQLKQLQMQINPHFFYNTFFVLQGMIEMRDLDCASQMLQHLGQFFRTITRSGQEYAPLVTEVSHSRAYTEIQKMRFENIAVSFGELPAAVSQALVPRLILQPLIENAYVHSLELKEGPGLLRIWFEIDGDLLHVHVTDDGNVSEETVNQLIHSLNDPETRQETTGILNIHRRLKIYYRGRGGLAVSRMENGGMHVILTIVWNGGDNHAQHTDRGQ